MKISLIEENRKRTVQNDVICKIRDLVNTRNLEFGDKLPSERFMSEKFEVNRNQIREAIRRLEFFGVLKSKAQSGTILNVGLIGFNAIINEIVSLDIPTFKQLVETRITIELKTVCLAAERRSEEDLQKIHSALHSLKLKLISGEDHLEDDLLFHIEIAKASKNNALLTFMLLITPSILAIYDKDTVCEGDKVTSEIKKHEDVYLAIKSKNVKLAKKMMKEHFVKLSQHLEGV
ncbi:MAG: GntR family transcriptional regulator [Bacteroidetes bacterium MedPE-SWsnd-G1]|nr:MAG: GntR family transcriptional regulator [Bacteroidetes bacterium MedPE-SWsnd-G1]